MKNLLDFQEALSVKWKYKKLRKDLSPNIIDIYKKNIPEWLKIEGDIIDLKTSSGTILCKKYDRIVIGDYGAFVEISKYNFDKSILKIKTGQEFRIHDDKFKDRVKYWWLTPKDNSDAKVYYQKKIVDYADYKPDYFYISVYEVFQEKQEGVEIVADIARKCDYPLNRLSNFACNPFVIDGVECMSMEGFLQSLKFKNQEMQKEICRLVGYGAKKRGKDKDWRKTQTLYWMGVEYKRNSKEYQELLDRAFYELSKNKDFQKALLETGDSVLTHSIGKIKISETVLTRKEFCSRLMNIRLRLKEENK